MSRRGEGAKELAVGQGTKARQLAKEVEQNNNEEEESPKTIVIQQK